VTGHRAIDVLVTTGASSVAGAIIGRLSTWPERWHLRRRVVSDTLTGLYNRDGLAEVAPMVLRPDGAPRRGRPGLLLIDLDKFKQVNDVYGHEVGNAVLREAARRLRATTADTGAVNTRLGGDELAALVPPMSAAHPCAWLIPIARRLHRELTAPYLIVADATSTRPLVIRVGASIGVAFGPPATDLGQLLRAADAAMYAAKRGGGGWALRSAGAPAARSTGAGAAPTSHRPRQEAARCPTSPRPAP
jgi:diguanylate cyclase (GGDEF)-like protein